MTRWQPLIPEQHDPPADPMAVPYVMTPADKSDAALYHCFLQRHVRNLNARDKAREAAQEAGEMHRLGVRE